VRRSSPYNHTRRRAHLRKPVCSWANAPPALPHQPNPSLKISQCYNSKFLFKIVAGILLKLLICERAIKTPQNSGGRY
jgi:hypothetical protein